MIQVACRTPAANVALIVGEGAEVMGIGEDYDDGPVSLQCLQLDDVS